MRFSHRISGRIVVRMETKLSRPPYLCIVQFVLFLFLLINPIEAHRFYVSLTDMEYNEMSGRLEIASKYFIDDMELALALDPGSHISMPMDKELLPLMDAYMNEHFIISCDKKYYSFDFLGYEIEDDVVWFYMESEKIPVFSEITIEASQLTEHFDSQQNIVHISNKGVIQSLFLRKDKAIGSLSY